MRTVQETLKTVINAGMYWGEGGTGCSYMCNALGRAAHCSLITEAEESAALGAISKYLATGLSGETTLAGFIRVNYPDYPDCEDCEDYTKLYLDWANRPGFKGGVAHANHG